MDQLKAAIDALVPRANKQSLEAVIATADKLSASAYTASSYAKLQAAVKAARPLLTDLNATQAAVAEQTNAVLTALQQLVKLPDKTELVKLITQAAGLKKDAYTEASFNDVQAALAQARTVQKDPEAREAQVAKAAADLKTAIDHLVKAAPEPDKKDPATPPVPAPNPDKKDPATPAPKPTPGGFQGGQPAQSGKTPASGKETNDSNAIPKTGEQTQSVLAVLGAALIGLLGYVKLRKHKHE